MSALNEFDPFEQRISAALDEVAAPRRPDYLDAVLRQTATTAQRTRWAFAGRWLPMSVVRAGTSLGGRLPVRPVLLMALLVFLLLAAVAAVAFVGSRHRLPPPYGLAGNGQIAYASNGDLYVRDALSGGGHLLVGGDGDQRYPIYSPDGARVAFSTTIARKEWLEVADADGSNVRRMLGVPLVNASTAWSPDSRTIAVTTDVQGLAVLYLVPADGSPVRTLDLGGIQPTDASWQPPVGDQILFKGLGDDGVTDLYTIRPDGTDLRALGLRATSATFGSDYVLSGAAFSPDGRTIAYNAIQLDAATSKEYFRVGLVAADGTGARLPPAPKDLDVQEGWPQWSPGGDSILVHRWTWTADGPAAAGWVAVMPAGGPSPARDIGPRIAGGEKTGITKLWSPDGTRVVLRAGNTNQVWSIAPATGFTQELTWATGLPDWQRVAP